MCSGVPYESDSGEADPVRPGRRASACSHASKGLLSGNRMAEALSSYRGHGSLGGRQTSRHFSPVAQTAPLESAVSCALVAVGRRGLGRLVVRRIDEPAASPTTSRKQEACVGQTTSPTPTLTPADGCRHEVGGQGQAGLVGDRSVGGPAASRSGYLKCPACGYWAFDPIDQRCLDCGWRA